jgi:hypothetical protein
MPSHPNAKEPSAISPDSAESASIAGERAGVEWPRLLARIVEGIVSAELHQFEENVMAFLNSAAADAYAGFVWLFARVIGACLLLTGLILFVGVFLEWWAVFALVGAIVIALSFLVNPKRKRLI